MGYRVDLSDHGKAQINATELVYYSGQGRVEQYRNTSGTLCRKDDFAMHFESSAESLTITPIKSCMRRVEKGSKKIDPVKMKAEMLALCMLLAEKGYLTTEMIDNAFQNALMYLFTTEPALANNNDLFPALMCNADTRLVYLVRSDLEVGENPVIIARFDVHEN